MQNNRYSENIDKAFGLLLMAKQMLDQVVPDVDDAEAVTMAAEFVADLIIAAIGPLLRFEDSAADQSDAISAAGSLETGQERCHANSTAELKGIDHIIDQRIKQYLSAILPIA